MSAKNHSLDRRHPGVLTLATRPTRAVYKYTFLFKKPKFLLRFLSTQPSITGREGDHFDHPPKSAPHGLLARICEFARIDGVYDLLTLLHKHLH